MDCLSHIHPTQIRTITPREAARIQSFPDDYFFLGPYLKTYMQIKQLFKKAKTVFFAVLFNSFITGKVSMFIIWKQCGYSTHKLSTITF